MKLELPAGLGRLHTLSVPIRWGDMDALGHVNNTLYFRYMEMARLDWMIAGQWGTNPNGEGPVIANAFCNFVRQLEFPGDVLVHTYVGHIGRTSFDTYHVMTRSDDPDTVYANGGATVVWVNLPQQKSVALPADLRQALEQAHA